MSFSVHTFEINPKEGQKLGFSFHEEVSEGQTIYFVAKLTEDEPNPQLCAESIFGVIVDSFKKSKISNAYDRFEEALKNANSESKKFNLTNAEILVAFFDFQNLYLSVTNDSEAYLIRGSNVSQITETTDSTENLFLNILSGQVSVDDTIILSTSRILRVLTSNQISNIFVRQNFEESVSIFKHELTTHCEENLLISIVGIGKKQVSASAGFLSKMVNKISTAKPKSSVVEPEENISKTETIPEKKTTNDLESEKDLDNNLENPATRSSSPIENIKNKISFLQNINFKNQKNIVVVAGAIFAILCVTILIKIIINFESQENQELREKLESAREALYQADTLLLEGERIKSGEFITKAEKLAQEIFNSKSRKFRSNAAYLLNDIEEKKLQIENARKISPKLIADLSIKNENLESMGLINLHGNLFIYDLKNIYKTVRNIVEKGLPILEKGNILAGSTREDQNTLLFLSDTPQIIEYKEGIITPMNTEDETWKKGIDIKTYGRYTYVLAPVENQIWKYERKRAKYSAAIPYNKGADLSRAVSFCIDGAIYILSDDGSLQKIFRGESQDYAFRNNPSVPFTGKNLKLYTSRELDFLYVLDPENSRVLIFEKGDRFATYKKQIIFDTEQVRDFKIDKSGQKINILTKDKIFEFSL